LFFLRSFVRWLSKLLNKLYFPRMVWPLENCFSLLQNKQSKINKIVAFNIFRTYQQ
jgi:hypothetical protein